MAVRNDGRTLISASPSAHGPHRVDFLAHNPIAVGPLADPEEFRREYERFRHLLPRRSPLHVLDVGCGTGAWSVLWVARGWMPPRDGRPARGRLLFYLGASTVSLYARRPAL